MLMNIKIPLNDQIDDFAERCFRDMADQDYISARLLYRAKLIPQFYWSGLQALEKYFKAILLFNRIKARNISHDLKKAQNKLEQVPFDLSISDSTQKLIEVFNKYGLSRYLDNTIIIDGLKLSYFDKAVWEIRRYCRAVKLTDNPDSIFFDTTIKEISDSEYPSSNQIKGGVLEKIIEDNSNRAREGLIWQNAFYGLRKRKMVRIPVYRKANFSPIDIFQKLIDEVEKYVQIPKSVKKEVKT